MGLCLIMLATELSGGWIHCVLLRVTTTPGLIR